MTQNQINYWNLQESKRHNVAGEQETNRHNVVTENETNRHNVATEGIDLGKLNETIRHNKASEGLASRGYDIQESQLRETNRHNIATENLGVGQLNLGYGQLAATNRDLDIKSQQQAETARHNQASEILTGTDLNIKSDVLAETNRHNVVGEQISKYQAVSQADLNSSLTALNEVRTTWEQINQSKNIALSDAKIRQINAGISKMEKEMSLLESQKTQTDLNNFWNTYNEIFSAVEALIPG